MLDENLFALGKITWNSFEQFFEWISDNPDKNEWTYETLLQVEYNGDLLLDVEWNNTNKMFVVRVVANFDWDNVIEKRLCHNLKSLERNVVECINIIKSKRV